jgi:hypothetical protein
VDSLHVRKLEHHDRALVMFAFQHFHFCASGRMAGGTMRALHGHKPKAAHAPRQKRAKAYKIIR